VIKLLRQQGLISEKRVQLLLSWQHTGSSSLAGSARGRGPAGRTGFGVRGETRLGPTDREAIEAVARYMVRCPTSLARLVWHDQAPRVLYREHDTGVAEEIDACDFVARVLTHVPDPRRHVVHYYGAYSNVSRGKRRKSAALLQSAAEEPEDLTPDQRERRRSWAEMIRRVYEIDPLVCPECGGEMRVVAFITDPPVIKKILDHLARPPRATRAPPELAPTAA
jgi:hypothetical protein